jgi:hypothetical protein
MDDADLDTQFRAFGLILRLAVMRGKDPLGDPAAIDKSNSVLSGD